MKVGKFTETTNQNGGTSVYYQGVFIGMYLGGYWEEINQFSGNKNQCTSMNLLLRYMRLKFPQKPINYIIKNTCNQMFLVASTRRLITEEGIVKTINPLRN